MTCKKRIVLTDAVRKKKLGKLLEDYLAECRPPPDADPKHSGGSFPNLAGFCSYLGCGIDEFEALRTTDPATADYLSAALEDAALNRSPGRKTSTGLAVRAPRSPRSRWHCSASASAS